MGFIECNTCGDTREEGLSLFKSYICKECLDKIGSTDLKDTIYYEYYKSKIKGMWIDYIAQMES